MQRVKLIAIVFVLTLMVAATIAKVRGEGDQGQGHRSRGQGTPIKDRIQNGDGLGLMRERPNIPFWLSGSTAAPGRR